MSVFRPAARVSGPDGREWELYAYRIELRRRDGGEGGFDLDDLAYGREGVLFGLFDGVFWLLGGLGRLLALLLWEIPRAAVRSTRSDEWTIEAATFYPARESYVWKTTREFRGHVLAQVEGQLARGEVPTPRHARYLGAR